MAWRRSACASRRSPSCAHCLLPLLPRCSWRVRNSRARRWSTGSFICRSFCRRWRSVHLLLVAFGTRGGLGAFLLAHFGIRFVFSWTGAALAASVITFPLQVRAIRLSIENADQRLNDAARTLGAGTFDRLLNITLPLALPGIIAGLITAFAASLGEFGAIITFVSNIPGETRTLPLAIYTALQTPGGEAEAARLSVLSILRLFHRRRRSTANSAARRARRAQ